MFNLSLLWLPGKPVFDECYVDTNLENAAEKSNRDVGPIFTLVRHDQA